MDEKEIEKDIKALTAFEQILDDTDQLIQISELDSFSMQYANKPARKFSNQEDSPYFGAKCYEYMMGLKEQCPFCPMRNIKDQEFFITEVDNGKQIFQVKTKKIMWEGKESFIEYAIDITTQRRAQKIFETQMQNLLSSIPEAQGIFHLNLTKNIWISSNGISKNVDELQEPEDVDTLVKWVGNYIPDAYQRDKFYEKYNRDELIKAYQTGITQVTSEVLSYYDDGSIKWARMTARLNVNPMTGDLECVLYGMDISNEKMYQLKLDESEREKIRALENSKRDMLTGTYSKKAFQQMSQEYIHICKNQSFAVVFLDLDNFKAVNDTLGHLVGDRAIVDTADKLQAMFSDNDIISRFGGDEFCILIKNIDRDGLIEKIQILLEKLRVEYSDEKQSVKITGSIGVVYSDGNSTDIFKIIQEADIALYQAKRNGRDQYCLREA